MNPCTYASSKTSNAGSNNDNRDRLFGLKAPVEVVVKIFHDHCILVNISVQIHAYIETIFFCVTCWQLGGQRGNAPS